MSSNRPFGLVFALAVAVAATAAACAQVSSPLGDNLGGSGSAPDFATAPPDLTLPSDSPPPNDLAAPPDLTAVSDLARPADLAKPRDLTAPSDLAAVASCHVVLNELQTQTTQAATEEFVELYNPCTTAVSVAGFRLGYRAASNVMPASASDSSTLYAFSGSLAAGAYFVVAGSSFSGTKNGTLASGLATSGSVALRDAAGAVVDSLAYGTVAAGNAFVEGAAAPQPPSLSSPGGSIERLPNGADSNDNSHDFATANAATPGAANH